MNVRLQQILRDPVQFCSRLIISDKSGKRTNLKLWNEQKEMLETLASGKNTYVLKARQIGSSTLCLAYLFWTWLTSPDPVSIVILTHKLSASRNLMMRFRDFYNNLPSQLQPKLSVDSRTQLVIENTGASVSIQSARQSGGARSFTATHLLISEFAFFNDPEEVKAQALAALNNGQLIIETTANYFGDSMYQEVVRLQEHQFHNEKLLFFPWFRHHAYVDQDYDNLIVGEDGLTEAQRQWKRRKVAELGEQKFAREYPSSVEEAYRNIGNEFFTDIGSLRSTGDRLNTVPPQLGKRYAIGVDTSAGTGSDPQAMIVVDAVTRLPVCEIVSNTMQLEEFADHIVSTSIKYNNAEILVESNMFGNVLLQMLEKRNARLWKNKWTTTQNSKIELLNNIDTLIRQGIITELPKQYISELRSFVYTDRHPPKVNCLSDGSHHGDRVIAYGLALQIVKQYNDPYLPRPVIPKSIGPSTKKNIFDKY